MCFVEYNHLVYCLHSLTLAFMWVQPTILQLPKSRVNIWKWGIPSLWTLTICMAAQLQLLWFRHNSLHTHLYPGSMTLVVRSTQKTLTTHSFFWQNAARQLEALNFWTISPESSEIPARSIISLSNLYNVTWNPHTVRVNTNLWPL